MGGERYLSRNISANSKPDEYNCGCCPNVNIFAIPYTTTDKYPNTDEHPAVTIRYANALTQHSINNRYTYTYFNSHAGPFGYLNKYA